MSLDPTVNEWTVVREQFEALVRERSDNIEDILDVQFRDRFSQLINRAAEGEHRTKRDVKPI